MLCSTAQSCPTLRPHGLQTTRLLCSWGFSRQEYWSGLPCPPPGGSNPGLPHCRWIFSVWAEALSKSMPCYAKSLQSCPTLCDPRDSSPPGSPIPGTLQARTLEWVAISFSNAWKWKVKVKSLSPVQPGSSIHGIFQARILEWDAIAFSVPSLYSYIIQLSEKTCAAEILSPLV